MANAFFIDALLEDQDALHCRGCRVACKEGYGLLNPLVNAGAKI
jgi:hypothetical protein